MNDVILAVYSEYDLIGGLEYDASGLGVHYDPSKLSTEVATST